MMVKTIKDPSVPQTRDPFQTLFGRLFGDALQGYYSPTEETGTMPANISENDQAYELAFELPGLDETNLQVNMQDHTLTVTAERKDDRETTGKRWHRVEHRYGRFARSIALPHDAANQGVEAVYKNGVLLVTVPKAPESRPTKIQVRTN